MHDNRSPACREPALVTLVVPAKNEEEAIGHTLRSLPQRTLEAMGLRTELVVLDGQSTDRTAEIARRLGATVITDDANGKGAALRAARSSIDGDIVVMLDADGTYAPDAIPRVVGPLMRDEADLVAGNRVIRPGAMRASHRTGNKLLSLQARALYGRPCPDLCTGLWGFRAAAFRALPLQSEGFELEADIFALSARLDLRTETVPVDYLPRQGVAKLSPVRDGLRIAWWLTRTRFAPLPTTDRPRGTTSVALGAGGTRGEA